MYLFCCLHAIEMESVEPQDLSGEVLPYNLVLETLEPKQLILGTSTCFVFEFISLAPISGQRSRPLQHRPTLTNTLIHPYTPTRAVKPVETNGDPLETIKDLQQQQLDLLSKHEQRARLRSLTIQKQRDSQQGTF